MSSGLCRPLCRVLHILGNTYVSTCLETIPDYKVLGANMGPTRVLSAPGGPHVGPMNLAIWDTISASTINAVPVPGIVISLNQTN